MSQKHEQKHDSILILGVDHSSLGTVTCQKTNITDRKIEYSDMGRIHCHVITENRDNLWPGDRS